MALILSEEGIAASLMVLPQTATTQLFLLELFRGHPWCFLAFMGPVFTLTKLAGLLAGFSCGS